MGLYFSVERLDQSFSLLSETSSTTAGELQVQFNGLALPSNHSPSILSNGLKGI